MEKKDLTAADVWAMFAETDRRMQETDRKLKELGGISNSNGKFAESLFYDSLETSKTFAGVHFDAINAKWNNAPRPFRAESDYPKEIAERKAHRKFYNLAALKI